MSGEKELEKLLCQLSPVRVPGAYVFCSVTSEVNIAAEEVIGTFREAEGQTIILSKTIADSFGWPYDGVQAWITLNVHSSLQAVGLTAAVSNALAAAGISCNVVAAYYHDHLFVPVGHAGQALMILQELAGKANSQ